LSPVRSYIAPEIDLNFSQSFQLELLVRLNAVRYLVRNNEGKVMAFKAFELQESLEDLAGREEFRDMHFRQDEQLQAAYKNTRIRLFARPFQLIPEGFEPADPMKLFPGTAHQNVSIGHSAIPEASARLYYQVRHDLIQYLNELFNHPDIQHSAPFWLNPLLNNAEENQGPFVLALISEGLCELAAIDGKTLLLYNAYDLFEAEDFLYYTALAYQTAGWDMHEVPLRLAGEIVKGSAIWEGAAKYFPHLETARRLYPGQLPRELEQMPAHFYFDLFTG